MKFYTALLPLACPIWMGSRVPPSSKTKNSRESYPIPHNLFTKSSLLTHVFDFGLNLLIFCIFLNFIYNSKKHKKILKIDHED